MKKIMKGIALVLAIMLVGIVFVACAPDDINEAKEKMQEKGYIVTTLPEDDDDIVGALMATKVSTGDVLYIHLCESRSDARDLVEDITEEGDIGTTVERSGKWVLVGTQKAIDDFLD